MTKNIKHTAATLSTPGIDAIRASNTSFSPGIRLISLDSVAPRPSARERVMEKESDENTGVATKRWTEAQRRRDKTDRQKHRRREKRGETRGERTRRKTRTERGREKIGTRDGEESEKFRREGLSAVTGTSLLPSTTFAAQKHFARDHFPSLPGTPFVLYGNLYKNGGAFDGKKQQIQGKSTLRGTREPRSKLNSKNLCWWRRWRW